MANTYEEKKRYVKQYIRSLREIEDAMEPFKEQKRELREEFREMGRLNTDELRAAVKAYRFIQKDGDMDQFTEMYDKLRKSGF